MGVALATSISSASSTEMTYLMYVIFILYYIILYMYIQTLHPHPNQDYKVC